MECAAASTIASDAAARFLSGCYRTIFNCCSVAPSSVLSLEKYVPFEA
ncbi:MAG TPA: hypothetical protein VHI13_06085 [Candidatus Kapabacteria bacterium]|nr:hypothetical protein [Candidatus Kapabacteria bacterium]